MRPDVSHVKYLTLLCPFGSEQTLWVSLSCDQSALQSAALSSDLEVVMEQFIFKISLSCDAELMAALLVALSLSTAATSAILQIALDPSGVLSFFLQ